MNKILFPVCALWLVYSLTIAPAISIAQDITRLTFDQGDEGDPYWDPSGNTIAYAKPQPGGKDIYMVQADGSGEGPMAILPKTGSGVAFPMSWVGSTGLLAVEERIGTREYMTFNSRGTVPFTRTATDGSDAQFTRLLSLGASQRGELISVSRDGKTAIIRVSESGSVGKTTIRVGAFSALRGGAATSFGKVLVTTNRSSVAAFFSGSAVSPDGTQVILPFSTNTSSNILDLFLFTADGSRNPVNITKSAANGITNLTPEFSPDGQKVIFARGPASGALDLFTMNPNGSELTQLTNTPGFTEFSPTSSPDGVDIAFGGFHLAGQGSQFPALLPGEPINLNIYRMNVRSAPIVSPTTPLVDPPAVVVNDQSVTITLKLFSGVTLNPLPGGSQSARLANAIMQAKRATPKKQALGKPSFAYEVVVTRVSDTEGNAVRNDVRRKIVKTNLLTLQNLKSGSYTANYRVVVSRKKAGKNKVVGRTGFSPAATFNIF